VIEQAIIIGLAAWRLAHLLIFENGPFDVLEKVRQFVGIKPGPIEGFLPQLFSCMMCMTVWMSLLCYLLYVLEPMTVIMIAAMAVALLADRFFNGPM
jgi:hypothetical protein